jgi:hypothetical protein
MRLLSPLLSIVGSGDVTTASQQVRRCGQGRGRTADLPLFRRLCGSMCVHGGLLSRAGSAPGRRTRPQPTTPFHSRC